MKKRKSGAKVKSKQNRGSSRNPWNSLLLIIAGSLAVYGAIHLGLWSLNTSYFELKEIRLSGIRYAEEDSVRSMLNSAMGKNLFKLNLKDLEDDLETLLFVEKARIFRNMPAGLNVEIEENRLLALYNTGNKLLVVDHNGDLIAEPRRKNYYDLPLISGIAVKSRQYYEAVEFLRAASVLSPSVYYEISGITDYSNTLTILLGDNALPVKAGSGNHLEKIIKLWALLNKPEIPFERMLYADVRFSQKIFFKRG